MQVRPTKRKVIVILDRSEDDVLKPFYCVLCGCAAFEYYGGVKFILPGQVEQPWVDIVGKPTIIHCKSRYRKRETENQEIRAKCQAAYQVIG